MRTETTRVLAGVDWWALCAGPSNGEPVVLLHGFPEDHRSWEVQIGPLAAAGYRVFAPDLPGYGRTSAPDSYRLDHLGRVVGDLAGALSRGGVHLVGHDWGGIVAHAAAFCAPKAIRSVVVACGPHPATFAGSLRSPRQIARSWYVGAFQLPGAARVVGAAGARRLFPGRVAGVTTVAQARRALAYYRTNLNPFALARHRIGRIAQPATIVHPTRDRYVGLGLAVATARQMDDLRGFYVLDAGHFVQRERAGEFNDIVLAHLKGVSPGSSD